MLDNYYPSHLGSTPATDEQKQRLIAVQAALELVKASLESAAVTDYSYAASNIPKLADAIQGALK